MSYDVIGLLSQNEKSTCDKRRTTSALVTIKAHTSLNKLKNNRNPIYMKENEGHKYMKTI